MEKRFWFFIIIWFHLPVFSMNENAGEIHVLKPAFLKTVLTGFTRARAEMVLVSEVAARCESVAFDIGDILGEDGRFAQLDATFVTLDLLRNRQEQKRLENRVAFLGRETARFQSLVEKQTISQSAYEDVANRLDQARLELEGLKIDERILEEKRARHNLKGAAGWRVIERHLEPGQWVAAGAEVARLGDYRSLYVPLAVDVSTVKLLREKDKLQVEIPDLGLTVPARLKRVSPGFDPQTRKIAVDLEIQDAPDMRGGLRVQLTIDAPGEMDQVLMPDRALEKRFGDLWVTLENGDQVRIRVLGKGPEGFSRVTGAGIKAGVRIVLKD